MGKTYTLIGVIPMLALCLSIARCSVRNVNLLRAQRQWRCFFIHVFSPQHSRFRFLRLFIANSNMTREIVHIDKEEM